MCTMLQAITLGLPYSRQIINWFIYNLPPKINYELKLKFIHISTMDHEQIIQSSLNVVWNNELFTFEI